MVYLFVGYFVLWALTFGYLFALGARQKQLQRELERFRQEGSELEYSVPESS
jgi:CcmD family protein